MKTSEMVLIGVAVLFLSRSRKLARVEQQKTNYLNEPTSWGADQWSRIYGDDLAMAGGQHDAQSSLTAYGFSSTMGFQGSAAR